MKEPINCLKIDGDQPVIISGCTAAFALESINSLFNMRGPQKAIFADDASFEAANIRELSAAYKATFGYDYEWKNDK